MQLHFIGGLKFLGSFMDTPILSFDRRHGFLHNFIPACVHVTFGASDLKCLAHILKLTYLIKQTLRANANRRAAGDSIEEDLMPASTHWCTYISYDTASVRQRTAESAEMSLYPSTYHQSFGFDSDSTSEKSPARSGKLRRIPMDSDMCWWIRRLLAWYTLACYYRIEKCVA